MAGRKVFSAGEVLQAADVNDFLMDQSVMVFAGTAARGSAIPSPTEGMVTYRSDDDVVEVYTTDWTPVGPGKILQVIRVSLGGSQISTTSTSFVTTGLSASITPRDVNSKVLVSFDATVDTVSTQAAVLTIDRDGTNLGAGTFGGLAQVNGTSAGRSLETVNAQQLDSPASASSVTYTLQFKSTTGAEVQVRRDLIPAKLVLMEVAG